MSVRGGGEGDAAPGALRALPAACGPVRPHGDRGELAALAARLQRGLVSGQDAAEALEHLRRALGVTGLVLSDDWSFNPWVQTAGELGDWPAVYGSLEYPDPSQAPLLASPFGTCYLGHPNVRQPIWGELRGCGFGDILLMRMPSIEGGQILAAFFRERGARLFCDDDVSTLALIYPHLTHALRSFTALRAFDRPADESREDFLHSGEPWARLTLPAGHIEWSAAARSWWEARSGPLSRPRWQALERALVRASRLPTRSHRLPAGALVELAPLPPAADGSLCMLALFRNAAPVAGGPIDLRAEAKNPAEECLSPRERQAARLYAAGFSAREIAELFGSGQQTVRTQLRSIYDKLGVSSRAELIALLWSNR